ncbi:MAG TPA: undecaprenyl-diphosphate phosphatase [Lachnospiraceae bacterium]
MSFIESIILGIVQGIVGFLPVSTTGHMILLQHLMGSQEKNAMLGFAFLRIGSLVAMIIYLRKDIARLFGESLRLIRDIFINIGIYFKNIKHQEALPYKKLVYTNYRKFLLLTLISSLLSGIFALFFYNLSRRLGNSLIGTGSGFLITGVILLVVGYLPKGNKIPKDSRYRDGIFLGILQGLSVFPGVSRFGLTLAGGTLSGFQKRYAIKYSFLIAIPAILASFFVEIGRAKKLTDFSVVGPYLLGAFVSGLVGYFLISFLLKLVEKRNLQVFAYYSFFIGFITIICNYIG